MEGHQYKRNECRERAQASRRLLRKAGRKEQEGRKVPVPGQNKQTGSREFPDLDSKSGKERIYTVESGLFIYLLLSIAIDFVLLFNHLLPEGYIQITNNNLKKAP